MPDSDALKKSTGPRTVAEGAQAAAQEAQAHARQVPGVAQEELGTGSGPQASSASKREFESRELGHM